jgi:hypothetical protein
VASAPLNENSSTYIAFKYPLGSTNEKGYAQALVVGDQIFVTTDTADVNSSTYGTGGTSTGKLYTLSFNGSATATTTIVAGASSAVRSTTGTYVGGGQKTQYATTATAGGTRVDPEATPKVSRKLWVRTE